MRLANNANSNNKKASMYHMGKIVFNPGCALSIYKPDMEHRILDFLQRHYHAELVMHNICCRHDPQLEKGTCIINVCAGCDRRFRTLYEGITTVSLWEILDQMDGLDYPDYQGAVMSIHDPCPIRQKPQVHHAVRSLLKKMRINLIEAPHAGEKSICCGDNFYPKLPVSKVNQLMKKRANEMPCSDVVVYCVSCIKSMHIGGKKPHHLLDLLVGEDTQAQIYETKAWHDALDVYIAEH
ncbi:(Fe-S)-binding protein [Eubacteriales bacterium OttesenSCG-928-K08]|nr:(Fe-S)-binding protein [Eubacteriales bacterium OttesenSCG-928-K08]